MDNKDNTPFFRPKPLAEILPSLSGIMSKESMQCLSSQLNPRPTMAPCASEKGFKLLTLSEMRPLIKALQADSPKLRSATSIKKKCWNSSVKVDKGISHTAGGKLKNNHVRKVLQFQPKPRVTQTYQNQNSRVNTVKATPKFSKPERVQKSVQVKKGPRISGIACMPETPVQSNKPNVSRKALSNKENLSKLNVSKSVLPKPTPILRKPVNPRPVPDTPLSNDSWKSGNDTSFLQQEKEVNDIEKETESLEKQTLLTEVSPPASTPFKEYRNVKDYFNNTSDTDNSCNDNTIMSFERTSIFKIDKKEESVIASLCDLLNKATVNNTENSASQMDDLSKLVKDLEHQIKMTENGIQALINIKEANIKALHRLKTLIKEKEQSKTNVKAITSAFVPETAIVQDNLNLQQNPFPNKRCSVIQLCQKSPSYKIPNKTSCLRKKVFHKSMPNITSENNKALNIYMQMKEQLNFLKTPVQKKQRYNQVPDTPTVTSQNLQMQIHKLYGDGDSSFIE